MLDSLTGLSVFHKHGNSLWHKIKQPKICCTLPTLNNILWCSEFLKTILKMQEMAFSRLQISKFSWEAYPRTPLEGSHTFSTCNESEVTIVWPVIYGQLCHWRQDICSIVWWHKHCKSLIKIQFWKLWPSTWY